MQIEAGPVFDASASGRGCEAVTAEIKSLVVRPAEMNPILLFLNYASCSTLQLSPGASRCKRCNIACDVKLEPCHGWHRTVSDRDYCATFHEYSVASHMYTCAPPKVCSPLCRWTQACPKEAGLSANGTPTKCHPRLGCQITTYVKQKMIVRMIAKIILHAHGIRLVFLEAFLQVVFKSFFDSDSCSNRIISCGTPTLKPFEAAVNNNVTNVDAHRHLKKQTICRAHDKAAPVNTISARPG